MTVETRTQGKKNMKRQNKGKWVWTGISNYQVKSCVFLRKFGLGVQIRLKTVNNMKGNTKPVVVQRKTNKNNQYALVCNSKKNKNPSVMVCTEYQYIDMTELIIVHLVSQRRNWSFDIWQNNLWQIVGEWFCCIPDLCASINCCCAVFSVLSPERLLVRIVKGVKKKKGTPGSCWNQFWYGSWLLSLLCV